MSHRVTNVIALMRLKRFGFRYSTPSIAASTASIAALGAIGPLGWRAMLPRAVPNSPGGIVAGSIFLSPMRCGGLPICARHALRRWPRFSAA